MSELKNLSDKYGEIDFQDLGTRQLQELRNSLRQVPKSEITSAKDGRQFIGLLQKFRKALAESDKLKGENYPGLLKSLLSVGEDGLYSNNLRFIFELIQNVDDCDFDNTDDCNLDIKFDFNNDKIVLSYNEVGFTPFNVFAITGTAEAAKNLSDSKIEIGEKGIGFKSVFGVADSVLIRSGWFYFELTKENFSIPVAHYDDNYYSGTMMTLSVPGRAREIYREIRDKYCRKSALFVNNPLLFLNKLTSLKIYYDSWRSMNFEVSRTENSNSEHIYREDNVQIEVNLHDYDNGVEKENIEKIVCSRYTYHVIYSQEACQSRYGKDTRVGSNGGKHMLLQAVVPSVEDVEKVGKGGLYSFLPTQLALTVPIVCHAPFKLDASREFVDPQAKGYDGGNLWFSDTAGYLAELMDYVYSDLAKSVKEKIVYYLPYQNESLFASKSEKVKCLINLDKFKGRHYLALPLFKTVDGSFNKASDVFIFDDEKQICNPIKAAKLLGLSKILFNAPEKIDMSRFGITVEKEVYKNLLIRAFFNPKDTNEIIEYLESEKYKFNKEDFPSNDAIKLNYTQIKVFSEHKLVAKKMRSIADDEIGRHKSPGFISEEPSMPLSGILKDELKLSETPQSIQEYMKFCGESCICIKIPENSYLPCNNGIVLSSINPLSSFEEFCCDMDPNGTFAIRVKLRKASKELDKKLEKNLGTAEEFINDLRNIRLTIKDSLGKNGYKNYIDLILNSGTDRNRFIQELLQNADDCIYPEGSIPSFSLYQRGNTITTEYNEVGFSRANIRAITALGESTKNKLYKLLNNNSKCVDKDKESIGEKGVGFKSVFAIASEVKIFSGEYNFCLKADEPTIPHFIPQNDTPINGTKMEILLNDQYNIPLLNSNNILELCRCLRQIKKININGHTVLIKDSDTERTITIDQRRDTYSKYTHVFSITDKSALDERSKGGRVISQKQQIVCYVSEKANEKECPVYNGLPTKCKIRIPMFIDAPFELNTSRENIIDSNSSWNFIIRKEMYNAIIAVIHARKKEDRADVLRFARFTAIPNGMYLNDLSETRFLNDYGYLKRLRSEKVLPTFDVNIFASSEEKKAYKYPEAANIIFSELLSVENLPISLADVIDPRSKENNESQKNHIEAVLNAFECQTAPFSKVFPFLQMYAEAYIDNDKFRKAFYKYLETDESSKSVQMKLRDMKIIPVYGINGDTQYISRNGNEIFVKKDISEYSKSYWILNEALLPKYQCEKILGININELTADWKQNRYRTQLQKIVESEGAGDVYNFLIHEFAAGMLQKNDCRGELLDLMRRKKLPLKNELGEIVYTELFICNKPRGYFNSEMLRSIISNEECRRFAEYINCRNLSDIYYDDFNYSGQLNADDIESLNDEYFLHQDEILRGFYINGYISNELLEEYNLEYFKMGRPNDFCQNYAFPENPVRDRTKIIHHIKNLMKDPVKVISVKEERSIIKGKRSNGAIFGLNSEDARSNTLQIYTPDGANGIAFCQMCQKARGYMFMEVNNLELNPKLYFPQTRVSLCLECSKLFEKLRENNSNRNKYLKAICNANIKNEGKIEIPVGNDCTLTFTAKHLAEIQEILKRTYSED